MSKITFYGQPAGKPFLGNPRYVFGVSPDGTKNWYMMDGSIKVAISFTIDPRWAVIDWPFDAEFDPNRGIEPKTKAFTKATSAFLTVIKNTNKEGILSTFDVKENYAYIEDGKYIGTISHTDFFEAFQEIPNGAFLSIVEGMKDKPKTITIPNVSRSSSAKVTADSIKVGCQKYNVAAIEAITAKVDEWRKGINFKVDGFQPVTVSPAGILVDGVNISFENYDKIKAAFAELKG